MRRLKGRRVGSPLLTRGSVERMKAALRRAANEHRHDTWRGRLTALAKRLKIPRTLTQNRQGIHMFILYALCLPVLLYRPSMNRLGIAATYFAYSGVQLTDNSCGGAIMKALDRYAGAIIAFIIIAPVLIALVVTGNTEAIKMSWLNWALVMINTSVAFFWDYVLYILPEHRAIPIIGISTLCFFTMQTNLGVDDPHLEGMDGYVVQVMKSILGRCTGYLLGLIVTVFVIPSRAEYTLMDNLEKALNKIETIMIPLISLDSGIVADQDVFQPLLKHELSLHDHNFEFHDFMDIKNEIWRQIEDVYRLMQPSDLMIEAAKVEKYLPIINFGRNVDEQDYPENRHGGGGCLNGCGACNKPRSWLRRLKKWWDEDCWRIRARRSKFSYYLYADALESVRALFYHVTSLYLILETHEAVLNDGINDNDHLAWGQTLKVGDSVMTIARNKSPNIKKYLTEPTLKYSQSAPRSMGSTVEENNSLGSGYLVSGADPSSSGRHPSTAEGLMRVTQTPEYATVGDVVDVMGRTEVGTTDEITSSIPLTRSVYDLSTLEVVHMISKQTNSPEPQMDNAWMKPWCKWAEGFGPCIGRISMHIAAYIEAMRISVATREIHPVIYKELDEVQTSLKELCRRRQQWQIKTEDMLKIKLAEICYSGSFAQEDPSYVKEMLEVILGISLEEYAMMDVTSRGLLWSNLGFVRDKMARFSCIIVALCIQLQRCQKPMVNLIRGRRRTKMP